MDFLKIGTIDLRGPIDPDQQAGFCRDDIFQNSGRDLRGPIGLEFRRPFLGLEAVNGGRATITSLSCDCGLVSWDSNFSPAFLPGSSDRLEPQPG